MQQPFRKVYNYVVVKEGWFTVREISKATKLSWPTVQEKVMILWREKEVRAVYGHPWKYQYIK